MKKVLYIILFLLICLNINAIDFIHGKSRYVNQNTRSVEQGLSYHSGTTDMLFYGTQKWAVNFIISEITGRAAPDTLNLKVVKIFIQTETMIPNTKITIFSNKQVSVGGGGNINQPNEILISFNHDIIDGWNTIELENSITVTNCWLEIDIPTSKNGPYIIAANGVGKHSYFFDSSYHFQSGYRNMENTGIGADLLFTLAGELKNPLIILQLIEFSQPQSITFDTPYSPNFIIKNNSLYPVNNVFIRMSGRCDSSIFPNNPAFSDSIHITTIAPGEQLNSNELTDFRADLIPGSIQYEVDFFVGASENEYPVRGITRRSNLLNVFDIPSKSLVELFAHSVNDIEMINKIINLINPEKTDLIFNFSSSFDKFHTIANNQRKNFYQNIGEGQVYINGDIHNNFKQDTNFENNFADNYSNSIDHKTFLDIPEKPIVNINNNSLSINVNLCNVNTILVNSVHSNLRVFAGLIQPVSIQGKKIMAFTQFLSSQNGDQVSLLIPPESQAEGHSKYSEHNWKIAQHNIIRFDQNSINDLSLFIWVQDRSSKKTFFHSIYPFETHLNIDEFNATDGQDIISVNNVRLFPNPMTKNSRLNIEFQKFNNQKDIKLSIFNIKGQKIAYKILDDRPLTPESLNIHQNGIYFMKIEWSEGDKKHSKINKIMIMK